MENVDAGTLALISYFVIVVEISSMEICLLVFEFGCMMPLS